MTRRCMLYPYMLVLFYQQALTRLRIKLILELDKQEVAQGCSSWFDDVLRGGGTLGVPSYYHNVCRLTTHFGRSYVNDYWLTNKGEVLLTQQRRDRHGPILFVSHPHDSWWSQDTLDMVVVGLKAPELWLQPALVAY